MSITDELREYFGKSKGMFTDHVLAIADRIDAEHQKDEDEWRAKNGDMWLKGYAACHEELMEGHPVIAADLEKAGWVRLPKDADGEYIRIGDEVKDVDYDGYASVFEMRMAADGWWVGAGGICRRPDSYRHCHAPTVEDVLEELLREYDRDDSELTNGEIVEMFAKRLQLREDA